MSNAPWNVYPRPRLRRAEWQCLNGEWELECRREHSDRDGEDVHIQKAVYTQLRAGKP